jgi:hypothetical protein
MNVDIDESDCKVLRNDFAAPRTDYQDHHGRAYGDYCIGITRGHKNRPEELILRKNALVTHLL